MADKSPRKTNNKKAGMSLKEKRAAKKLKHSGSGGIGPVDALRVSKTTH
jgi:hypothetical protein